MKSSKAYFMYLIFASILLTSCAENLPQDIPQTYEAPTSHTFDAPFSKVWKETIRILSRDHRIQTLDKESGLIVTEYLTVNKRVLTMFDTMLFGRTYKNSYSINISEITGSTTDINIQSNLQMEQFAVYNRERSVAWFEAYLRQDLFSKICNNLYQSESSCDALFPRYKSTFEQQPAEISNESYITDDVNNITDENFDQEIVREIQTLLQEKGYSISVVDGIYGDETSLAIKEFQLDSDLDIDGIPSQELLEMLKN